MSTILDLPASARAEPTGLLTNPNGNGRNSFRYTSTDGEQVMRWLVPGSDVQAFRTAALFRREDIALPGGGTMNRVVPLVCPLDDQLYALEVSGDSFSAATDEPDVDDWSYGAVNPWDLYIVTVKFGVLPYSFVDTPYISVRRTGRSTGITLPNHVYSRAGGTERTTQDIVIPCFQEEFIVTRHEVTDLDAELAIIEPLAGMCNDAAIALNGRSYPLHTLHFPEFDAELAISFGGSRKASISYPVRWRPRPTWQQVQWTDGSIANLNPLPLLTGNLGPLFGV